MIEQIPFRELETERLILKPHSLSFDYAEMVYRVIKENGVFLTKFLDKLLNVKSPEDEYTFFMSSVSAWNKMEKAEYGIYTKENQFIGTCGIFNINYDAASCEIGYWLSSPFNGKGYMTEAIKALENEFFNRGFNRMTILMDSENSASEKVAIRCGFKKEGVMREWHYNPTFKSFRDMNLYSKLKSEWEKQK